MNNRNFILIADWN